MLIKIDIHICLDLHVILFKHDIYKERPQKLSIDIYILIHILHITYTYDIYIKIAHLLTDVEWKSFIRNINYDLNTTMLRIL